MAETVIVDGGRERRDRRLAALLAAVFGTLLALLSLWALAGHALVALLWRVRGLESGVAHAQSRVDEVAAAFFAAAFALAVLVALLGLLSRVKVGVLGWIACLCLWWIGVELAAAQHLSQALGLRNFYFVRDPDHLPEPGRIVSGFNSDGLRATPESAEFERPGLNLLFLGDSFTYGFLVQPEQAFAAKVRAALAQRFPGLDVRVANFGWTGSSPLLSLRRLRAIGERYRPQIVVLFFDMTDFHDDLMYGAMLERRGIYWWYDKLPITLALLESWVPSAFWAWYERSLPELPRNRYFACESPLEQTWPRLEPTRSHIAEIDRWCREHGARFVLFVFPRAFQFRREESHRTQGEQDATILGPYSLEPFRWFEELKPAIQYPIHSLMPAFLASQVRPLFLADDPHWNADGHTVAADAIAPILEQEIRTIEEH